MVRSCMVFNCRGNYPGEPYTKQVSSWDEESKRQWIAAMSNMPGTLNSREKIWICVTHFEGEWKSVQGGRKPINPPSIFPGVPKSCLKQTINKPRTTKKTTADTRRKSSEVNDKIKTFEEFCTNIKKKYKQYSFVMREREISMFQTDLFGRKVVFFMQFSEVTSPCGFLKLVVAESNGIEVSKQELGVARNSLIQKWTDLADVIKKLREYKLTDHDYSQKALEYLNSMENYLEEPTFQFILEQLSLLFTHKNGRRYQKHVLVFAAELFSVSPAAFRLLKRSGMIIMPNEGMIRSLLSKAMCEENLRNLFIKLNPKQRLVNILFDEVKLKQSLRFTAGHIQGYAEGKDDILATSALVFEMICHHGGPRYILKIVPVARLNALQLRDHLLDVLNLVREKEGSVISFISDNCSVNVKTYSDMNGPGQIELDGSTVYLTHDYDHIYKNIRNNWITEPNKELSFIMNGTEYKASWSDVVKIYEEDQKDILRLTKLTYSAVYPKPLQRQNTQLVCQVFHEKTYAAMRTLQSKLKIDEGTILWIQLVTNWYKMMSVKSKYQSSRMNDQFREAWTKTSTSFENLEEICKVLSTCISDKVKGRKQQLTKSTGNAFILTTKSNILAAKSLLETFDFEYVLPSAWSQNPVEKFFGQARQRSGGNFYIDIVDVRAAAKAQHLHQLLKYDVMPVGDHKNCKATCTLCSIDVFDDDKEVLDDIAITDTEILIHSDDTLKQKVVYVSGYLTHKYDITDTMEDVECRFTNELDRGKLRVPTLNTVYFVHSGYRLYENLNESRRHCCKYFEKLLSLIDSPISSNTAACRTLSNLIFKARVIKESDKENAIGCLRRREKLSS